MKIQRKNSMLQYRMRSRYSKILNSLLFRRPLKTDSKIPYISFTFDDFPRSALHAGGNILARYDLRATYYVSFGLMGLKGSAGEMFIQDDVRILLDEDHELGSHTFSHSDSLTTNVKFFEQSIIKNQEILDLLIPGASFRSFSYPLSIPRPSAKYITSRYFDCCRVGGQTFNAKTIDLNHLKAYFIEKSRDDLAEIKETIDKNNKAHGWLIFATHDISENPSPYGCTPHCFEEIVKYAIDSSVKILPVVKALDAIYNEGRLPEESQFSAS